MRLPLLGLAVALSGTAAAQSPCPSSLLDAWAAAYTAGPGAPVARLYAADARLLGEISPREAVGHAEIASYFTAIAIGAAPPSLRIESCNLRGMPGAAHVSGRYTLLREGWDGVVREEPGRFSLALLAAPGGGWLIAGQHSSANPAPPR